VQAVVVSAGISMMQALSALISPAIVAVLARERGAVKYEAKERVICTWCHKYTRMLVANVWHSAEAEEGSIRDALNWHEGIICSQVKAGLVVRDPLEIVPGLCPM
jgi:hypothetical protein